MLSTWIVFLAFIPPLQGAVSRETAVFVGSVKLPMSMTTGEGKALEMGNYKVEIRIETGQHLLFFFKNGKEAAVVKGQAGAEEPYKPEATPVCGTVFLHPADIPIGTEEERRQSKTGRTQYEEETRDWGATLRIYSLAPEKAEVDALFYHRQKGSFKDWNRVLFKLFQDKRAR